jgi:hypothetical protein
MKPAWRTVVTVLSLALCLLAALAMCAKFAQPDMFKDAVFGLLGLGGVQGLKSSAEHVAAALKKPEPPK